MIHWKHWVASFGLQALPKQVWQTQSIMVWETYSIYTKQELKILSNMKLFFLAQCILLIPLDIGCGPEPGKLMTTHLFL